MNWYDKIIMLFVNGWQTSFGQTGQNLTISDTAAKTGNWTAVQVLSNAVIASITIDGATAGVVRMYGGNNATLPI